MQLGSYHQTHITPKIFPGPTKVAKSGILLACKIIMAHSTACLGLSSHSETKISTKLIEKKLSENGLSRYTAKLVKLI